MKMRRSVAVKAAKLPHAAWALRAYGRYALGARHEVTQALSTHLSERSDTRMSAKEGIRTPELL